MFSIIRQIFFIALIFLAVSAAAYEKAVVNLGFAYDRFRYSESNMDEQGWLPGIYLGSEWIVNPQYSVRARADYYRGNLTYNGSAFDGTPILNNKTKDWILNIELGSDINLNERVAFNIGLATRIWYDDLVISYTRKTTYYYLPVGLTYNFNGGFSLKAVQNYWLVGNHVATMSSVPHTPPYSDINVKQPSGTGWGVELLYRATNNSKANLEIAVYWREWHVDASTTEQSGGQTLYEPKNKSDTLGFNLGVAF